MPFVSTLFEHVHLTQRSMQTHKIHLKILFGSFEKAWWCLLHRSLCVKTSTSISLHIHICLYLSIYVYPYVFVYLYIWFFFDFFRVCFSVMTSQRKQNGRSKRRKGIRYRKREKCLVYNAASLR